MDSILIAGDLFPTSINNDLFASGKVNELFGSDMVELFNSCSYRIANLEGPLSEHGIPIRKSGPNLIAPTNTITAIKKMEFDCLSIANNHIGDYGFEGLKQTLETLNKNKISYLGVGINLSQAKIPYIFNVGKYKIGVYACAEFEFTIATDDSPGANSFDPLEICDDISGLRQKVDYLIVLYHGMKEFYRYPAPYVVKRCRKMVDKGADLVLCQHSHCIGCYENYKESTILYGQGDFCFCNSNQPERETGLITKVFIPSKLVEFIPVRKYNNIVRLAKDADKEKILEEFFGRSNKIKDPEFISKNYEKFARSLLEHYDSQLLGKIGLLLRKLRLTRISNLIFSTDRYHILNTLRCEAHRDIYIQGLMNILKPLN